MEALSKIKSLEESARLTCEYEATWQEAEPPKDFRPEHLKRMGVTIMKGDGK